MLDLDWVTELSTQNTTFYDVSVFSRSHMSNQNLSPQAFNSHCGETRNIHTEFLHFKMAIKN